MITRAGSPPLIIQASGHGRSRFRLRNGVTVMWEFGSWSDSPPNQVIDCPNQRAQGNQSGRNCLSTHGFFVRAPKSEFKEQTKDNCTNHAEQESPKVIRHFNIIPLEIELGASVLVPMSCETGFSECGPLKFAPNPERTLATYGSFSSTQGPKCSGNCGCRYCIGFRDCSPRREEQLSLNQRLVFYPVLRNRPCPESREPPPAHFPPPMRRARAEC